MNCIVGDNGMGKTNLLDALYYSCFTKSYFSSSDQFIFKDNQSFFRIEGKIDVESEINDLVIKMPLNGRKVLSINHKELPRRLDYLGKFTGVMIAPDDNQVILGGSELRRKFINNCISQYRPGYLNVLLPYQKLIRQRNAALKQFLKRGKADLVLLDTLDEQMVEHGSLIYSHRKEFMRAFLPIFLDYHALLVGNKEAVNIDYDAQLNEVRMEVGLQQARQKDLITGRSSYGPHKDDLKFLMEGQPLKNIGSQGQQKSFLVALKLAQYDLIQKNTKQSPFLFLDDLFDKFDESRVHKLIELIQSNAIGQVFITDTHPERIQTLLKDNAIEHQIIKVDKGTISYG